MNTQKTSRRFLAFLLLGLPCCGCLSQVYTSSGSTGSDGALAFPNAKAGDTILFDPASYNPKLDPAGDGVFNFTTITIPTGVTVKLSGAVLHGPVYWLATGAVDIEGTLDLSGAAGVAQTNMTALRVPATPGAGGYSGGVAQTSTSSAEPGLGPLGGRSGGCAGNGGFGANVLLVPLFGGSGGGGSDGGGGAGGGAILIASSSTITVNGTIAANGGSGNTHSGAGAGGGIRLVAQTIAGHGNLTVSGGASNCGVGTSGIIRLEGNSISYTGGESGNVAFGTPFATFVPTAANPPPTVRVQTVGGVTVNPNPTGSFTTPDVTINTSVVVPVVVQASYVPLGTIIHLQIYSDNAPDILVDTPGLAGTLASSTATVNVTFPSGYSRGLINASFTTTN